MKGFEELQQLWQGQAPEPTVSFEAMVARMRHSRRALARKLYWQSIALAAAIVVLVVLWVLVPFATWTSYLALTLMVGSIVYYLVVQLAHLRQINNSHALLAKPGDYIQYLQQFKTRRNRLNTRHYLLYEIALALAFALYAVEMYFAVPVWLFITFQAGVAMWFLFCHFVLMKRYIQQENERIEDIIAHLQRIQKQFGEEKPQ